MASCVLMWKLVVIHPSSLCVTIAPSLYSLCLQQCRLNLVNYLLKHKLRVAASNARDEGAQFSLFFYVGVQQHHAEEE